MKYINYLPNHKYGWLPIMYSIIYNLKPKKIIEYGTQTGGTAVSMGLALKDLHEMTGHVGHVYSYDLFESESAGQFSRDIEGPISIESSLRLVSQYGLHDYISISYGDFNNHQLTEDCDILYFDIGNHGENVNSMYDQCKHLIQNGLVVLFEGGSEERDNVSWMKVKNKQPINAIKNKTNYQLLTDNSKYSLSIIYNKDLYEFQ